MKLIQLSPEEQLKTGYTHKAIVTYADVETYATGSAGSQSATVPLAPEPLTEGGAAVNTATGDIYECDAASYRVRTTFTGVTTLTCAVHAGGNAMVAAGVVVASSQVAQKRSTTSFSFTAGHMAAVFVNATGVEVLSSLTAGAVDIYFKLVRISDLDRNI